MRHALTLFTVVLAVITVAARVSFAHISESDQRTNARLAISESPGIADQAIRQLRENGPFGLAAMQAEFANEIRAAAAAPYQNDPRWRRISAAIDAVAGQKDAHTSGLFWYTDMADAKTAAGATGKPILSLRLLGRLDTELSCANSRFFRTVLYANADVSQFLREHFILHWESVRPVPVVTIDMGDGRKICRTITGNSIHYVLDAEGRPIDAIPGLYGPAAFRRALESAEAIERAIRGRSEIRDAALVNWHADRAKETRSRWARDLRTLGILDGSQPQVKRAQPANVNVVAVPAQVAMQLTASKGDVERPIMVAVIPGAKVLADTTTDSTWKRIAELHSKDARLDEGSRALVRAKLPNAAAAGRRAATKRKVEDPLLRVVNLFEQSIAEDTVRNEYTMHRQIHEWFAAGSAVTRDVKTLNERVYADLFLTPSTDPWLGLAPAETYSAIENGGVSSR